MTRAIIRCILIAAIFITASCEEDDQFSPRSLPPATYGPGEFQPLPVLARDLVQRTIDEAHELARRGLFGDIGSLFGLGGSSSSSTSGGGISGILGGLLGGGGSGNSSGGLGGIVSGLLDKIDVNGAASALGTGVGSGAAYALKFTTVKPTVNATGIDGAVESLGMSLTSSLLSSMGIAGGLTGAGGASGLLGNIDIAGAASSVGVGVGNGVATAFKLPTVNATPAGDNSTINAAAQSLSSGLTSTLLEAVAPNGFASLASKFGLPAGGAAGLLSNIDIAGAASSVGVGVGNGVAAAFKLPTINTTASTNDNSTINAAAQSLSSGLTSTLLEAVAPNGFASLASTFGLPAGGATGLLSNIDIASAASAVGVGVGKGVATAFKLATVNSTADSGNSINDVAESLTSGLTSTVLEAIAPNGISSLTSLGSGLSTSALSGTSGLLGGFGNINLAQVGEGVGRGLIDGVGEGVQNAGGLQALISGKAVVPGAITTSQLVASDNFNDSVGGAAMGLARGLGSEGVGLVVSLLQPAGSSTLNVPSSSNSNVTTGLKRRDHFPELRKFYTRAAADNSSIGGLLGGVGSGVFGGLANSTIASQLTNDNISALLQLGVDDLKCEGVGGLSQVGLALFSNFNKSSFNFGQLSKIIGNQTISITSGGNNYTINSTGLAVNGFSLLTTIILVAAHGTNH
jgi:hypothetical protein